MWFLKGVGECSWTFLLFVVLTHFCCWIAVTLCKYWHYSAFVALLLFEGRNSLPYYLGYCSLSIRMYFDTFCLLVSTICDTMYFFSRSHVVILTKRRLNKVFSFCRMTLVYGLCTCACHSLMGFVHPFLCTYSIIP